MNGTKNNIIFGTLLSCVLIMTLHFFFDIDFKAAILVCVRFCVVDILSVGVSSSCDSGVEAGVESGVEVGSIMHKECLYVWILGVAVVVCPIVPLVPRLVFGFIYGVMLGGEVMQVDGLVTDIGTCGYLPSDIGVDPNTL
jgi:hypothetical protein